MLAEEDALIVSQARVLGEQLKVLSEPYTSSLFWGSQLMLLLRHCLTFGFLLLDC